jgi:ABC-type lipoprotein release transport system permease subunit
MLSLYRTVSLRYLRLHALRTLLIIASIALGVATLVATRILNDSMVKAARHTAAPMSGICDLLVSNDNAGVPVEAVTRLQDEPIPGLRAAYPLVLAYVHLPDLNNRRAILVGFDPQTVAGTGANPWGVVPRIDNPLPLLLGDNGVLVGTMLAAELPGGIADFRVRAAGREKRLAGAGTVDAHGDFASLGGSVLVMNLTNAAALVNKPDHVTRIDLVLEPGASTEEVRQRVEERLGGVAREQTPEMKHQSMH